MLLITILGPTATGKTHLAAHLAHLIGGEVISADSRQVYRGMDIGTGKDLEDYCVAGTMVPHHLIDIAEPGDAYDLFRFVNDFNTAFRDISSRGRQPILCGGSGMYLEAVIRGYQLHQAAFDPGIIKSLESLDDTALIRTLTERKALHNVSDTSDRNRLIRAVLIALSEEAGLPVVQTPSDLCHLVFGITLPRDLIRARITTRLMQRLDAGLVGEVQQLLDQGITADQLRYYGLEYRYVTDYCTGVLPFEAMVSGLNTAIHQFAKRQMTWFRRMEKNKIPILWIPGDRDVLVNAGYIQSLLNH
jgi:tRNA dimethylallyltransferase